MSNLNAGKYQIAIYLPLMIKKILLPILTAIAKIVITCSPLSVRLLRRDSLIKSPCSTSEYPQRGSIFFNPLSLNYMKFGH